MTLELQDVCLRVGGQTHIHPTTLALEAGGFNTLLGETLAGKTTLLRLMAGLVKPSEGRLRVDGRDVTGVPVQQRGVSMVYQQFINYPNLSVFENIASPLRVTHTPAAQVKERVGRIAELLRLAPLLDRKPAELSGGQQQRTALARALVKDATLVLLDEPLANLDYKLRESLRDELPRLFADRGCTVVYATTEPAEALLLGGHVATLHQGRVTQFGRCTEVYRVPADLTSAKVFSDPPINVAAAHLRDGQVVLDEQVRWPAPAALRGHAGAALSVALRPHHVRPGAAAGVTVQGKVLICEISGSESVTHFQLAGTTWVSQAHGVQLHPVGEQARFALDIDHCLYFDEAGRRIAA
ncbi:MAG: ABC transporter ATP-binding protein [Piscinibacter sp.]|uniref:ABC transporter ATP-binding protein n=1 Tax=Piscinibacter TaxID=1114981 RepID=UPI000FDD0BF2|nr:MULTISPECIES: ABC transporter ATP-binding protein [Piscinibacter]MCW5667990.1 ABC transporter ATP-binding protein [Piscinibacter sp.]